MAVQQPTSTDHRTETLNPVHTRAPVFTPRSGPPGATVTVETKNLPAMTPIYLGLGATRSSFEVLTQLVTDQGGEMSEVVRGPVLGDAGSHALFRVGGCVLPTTNGVGGVPCHDTARHIGATRSDHRRRGQLGHRARRG